MRVVVLGGTGNFGARIVRALKDDSNIELICAGRHGASAMLDIHATDFGQRLAALKPDLVIHCVGPFQGQDYRVATATLAAGSHYMDLADGREFVTQFAAANDATAKAAGRIAISGASTLPALSSAVIDSLQAQMSAIDFIEIAIAPGQRAARGTATLAAVLSYLGRPIAIWQESQWRTAWGWMALRRIRFDFGNRVGACCDVPDLSLLPGRYPTAKSISFHAALEIRMQHIVLWMFAALRRAGVPLPVGKWARFLDRAASLFDRFAGPSGGMQVSVTGTDKEGAQITRTWHLTAPALHGPEIPCLSAIVLARRMARGEVFVPGAHACMGFLGLAEFLPEFTRWGIVTRIDEMSGDTR
jgi:saccharopine dehydrogenase-like NADP-dependent oxidoreductase